MTDEKNPTPLLHTIPAMIAVRAAERSEAGSAASLILGRLSRYAKRADDHEAISLLEELWFTNDRASADSDPPENLLIWASQSSPRELIATTAIKLDWPRGGGVMCHYLDRYDALSGDQRIQLEQHHARILEEAAAAAALLVEQQTTMPTHAQGAS